MQLGERLRQARLEAGLSQRQLCGEEITRNMLSLIENGTAKPSMKTLQYLSSRLGKSVSYFLDETAVVSPNQSVMEAARRMFDAGEYTKAALALEEYREPDAVFDREKQILWVLTNLELAQQAVNQNKVLYAAELLEKAAVETAYCNEELNRQRLLIAGSIGARVSDRLPSLDEELQLRATEALAEGEVLRAAQLLDAVEDKESPRWNLRRGETYVESRAFKDAARCFHKAETAYPKETAAKLERCYRELGDYRQAYEYACKQR